MKNGIAILIILITSAGSLPAQVINYEIDPGFDSGLTFNRGAVSDILYTETDTYMIMGMFFGFNDAYPLAGTMITTEGWQLDDDQIGGFLVSPYKNEYLQHGGGLRRFNIPGSINSAFRFEFEKQPYSGPLSTKSHFSFILPDDHILVAGRFFTDSTLMGTASSHLGLRQLCMIDSLGGPVPGFAMLRCAEPVDAELLTIDQLSTGGYIVAGRFLEIEGHTTRNMAKLNADFTVDTSFVSPFASGYEARTSYVDSQDRIWMINYQGSFLSSPADTVHSSRLFADGSVDDDYAIPIVTKIWGNYVNNYYYGDIHEDSDGTFLVVGGFSQINGTPRKGIAKIYDDGSLVPGSFENLGADSADWGDVGNPILGPNVWVIEPLPGGKILLGGSFSSFGGEPYSCLVRLQPNGTVGLEERQGRGALKVYPNPAATGSRVQLALPDGYARIARIELLDLRGRLLRGDANGTAVQGGSFSLGGVRPGVYVLRASGSGGVYTQKLVVE